MEYWWALWRLWWRRRWRRAALLVTDYGVEREREEWWLRWWLRWPRRRRTLSAQQDMYLYPSTQSILYQDIWPNSEGWSGRTYIHYIDRQSKPLSVLSVNNPGSLLQPSPPLLFPSVPLSSLSSLVSSLSPSLTLPLSLTIPTSPSSEFLLHRRVPSSWSS